MNVYINSQFLAHSSQNPWTFLSYKSSEIIFGLLSSGPENASGKVTFGSHRRREAACQESQPCDQRVGPFSPNAQPLGRAEQLEVESVAKGQ